MTTPRYDVAELGCGLPRLVPPPLLLPWEQESPSHPSISAHLLSTAWLSFASGVGSFCRPEKSESDDDAAPPPCASRFEPLWP